MMKRYFKGMKSQKWVLGFIGMFLFALLLLPSGSVEAAKKPTCVKKMTAYICAHAQDDGEDNYKIYKIRNYSKFIYIKNLSSNAKITNVKSSNKKIKAYSGLSDSNNYNYDYDGDGGFDEDDKAKIKAVGLYNNGTIKPGDKTTISFTVKQGGKSYKLSCKVTFKEMPSPVKTLKIGKWNYASFLKGNDSLGIVCHRKKVKITVEAASGYKIDSIYVCSGPESKKIKNGTTIELLDDGESYVCLGGRIYVVKRIYVNYHMTKKPTNYQKPLKGSEKALLSGSVSIGIYFNLRG